MTKYLMYYMGSHDEIFITDDDKGAHADFITVIEYKSDNNELEIWFYDKLGKYWFSKNMIVR